jgi:ribonuclease BN (tRNA processing enzyme)
MKYKQLGNGGGLSPQITNSSFVIKSDNDYLLFDIGYNIMLELTKKSNKLISKINTVFISHLHDDHVGNLSTFISYRKFILNKDTFVICSPELLPSLSSYMNLMECSEHATLIDTITYNKNHSNKIQVISIDAYHGKPISSGALFFDKKGYSLFISGDTIASTNIEKNIREFIPSNSIINLVKLHDMSFSTSKTHATFDSIKSTYSSEFCSNMSYYHTRFIDFPKNWVKVNKIKDSI